MGEFFVAGGTMRADAPSYVERSADREMLSALLAGQFCYVLDSRQMGKSSLMSRAISRLQAEGVSCAKLDLQRFGTNLDVERWYAGLLNALGEDLGCSTELFAYWSANQMFGPLERWMGAIEHVVLPRLGEARLVVFVDEIDFVRSLPFSTDEFFAGIRELYNRRSSNPKFSRLAFCLLGVATPTDLISHSRITPFNIGERIHLKDFTLDEAKSLAAGLHNQPQATSHQPLLERVFYWTNGHPYLTQSLCSAIAADSSIKTPGDVDALVKRDLFEPKARETNINLADVANRALHAGDLEESPEKFRADLLSAYEKAWKGKPLADDESNRVAALLKLSGIMRSEGNQLKVRNRIYVQVFNRAWVRENMPGQELRRQRRSFYLGVLRTTGIAVVVVAAIGALAWKNSKLAERNARLVVDANGARDNAEYEAYVAQVNQMKMAYDGNDLMLLDRLLKATANSPYRNLEWNFWNASLHDTTRTIDYPTGIGYVAFSSDGMTLGIQDLEAKRAAIYSVSTMKRLAPIPNVSPDDTLFCLDGRWLFLNGADTADLRVRDAVTSRPLYDLKVQGGVFEGWWTSSLGRAIVAKWRSRTDPNAQDITVWDARTGRKLHTYHSLDGRVNTAEVSDDGNILAYAAVNGSAVAAIDNYYGSRTAIVRDLQHGNARLDEVACGGRESNFAVSSDGRYLTFGSSTGRIVVRDIRKRQTIIDRPLPPINTNNFSRDGKRMLVTTENLAAFLFELPSRQPVAQEKGAFGAALSPDGQLFAVSGLGTRIYDGRETGSSRLTHFPNTWCFLQGINSAGKLVAATGHAVRRVDLITGKEASKPIRSDVSRVALSQDANWCLMRAADDSVDVLSTTDGTRLCRLPVWNDNYDPFDVTLDRARVAALDVTGRFVAVFDSRDGRELWRFLCSEAAITCRWSPAGNCLAVGLGSGDTLILDARTHTLVNTLRGPNGQITQLAFSADGKHLATASYDIDLYIFSVYGNERVIARGHSAAQESVVFSPDGLRVVTASDDGTVRAWDARTGRQVLQIGYGTVMQCSAMMDASGERLFTSDFAGNIYMYRLQPTSDAAQPSRSATTGGP